MVMSSMSRILTLVFFGSCFLVGFVTAGSSTGTNPGFGSLPTSFAWEGDKLLNGQDAGDMFDDSLSHILDSAEAAGMVMYSTGASANNTTAENRTLNNTPTANVSDDMLSGYASVGDIIKAQDWAALQRYTAGINAASEIPDSALSPGNQNYNWDKLFTEPQAVSCGGC